MDRQPATVQPAGNHRILKEPGNVDRVGQPEFNRAIGQRQDRWAQYKPHNSMMPTAGPRTRASRGAGAAPRCGCAAQDRSETQLTDFCSRPPTGRSDSPRLGSAAATEEK